MSSLFTPSEILPAVAMACFFLTFVVDIAKSTPVTRAFSSVFLFAGSLCCFGLLVYRGIVYQSLPLRGMFEIFLLLGALVWVISIFSSCVLSADARIVDGVIGFVLMVPTVFVFERASGPIPPVLQSPLFAPHVIVYMVSYLLVMRAAVFAVAVLAGAPDASKMDSQIRLAFPFMTAGLILGSVWGKLAWGDWWNWDPKELWALAAWLVFAAFMYLRLGPLKGRYERLAAAVAIAGFVCVVLTLVWVNLSHRFTGLHSYA